MSENKNNKESEAEPLPIFYSLRNCPYAMRARIAVFKAKQTVQLRDLVLSDKPEDMLIASPKGTVPVLVLSNGTVIDESLDVMLWALGETDPDDLLHRQLDNNKECNNIFDMLTLINEFDVCFKVYLEQYKCAKRYKEDNVEQCREACELYVKKLEQRLSKHLFLFSDKESLADIALLPFIRQFAQVERQWYLQSPYPKLRQWLNNYLQSSMFIKVMVKYPLWLTNNEEVLFGGNCQ